jgi:hypothetical protein
VRKRRSKTENGIPLFLLPQAIARQIRERGSSVYRISVKRTNWHHYNVTIRTKAVPRELRPGIAAAPFQPGAPGGAGTSVAGGWEGAE